MKYRVHRFGIRMTEDQVKLEQFLNNLDGEVVDLVEQHLQVSWETATGLEPPSMENSQDR